MSQFTIRNLPEHVEAALRSRAREQGESLSETIGRILEREFGYSGSDAQRHRDLSSFAGVWTDEEANAVEETSREARRVDAEVWES